MNRSIMRHVIAAALTLCLGISPAAAADTKISAMPSATTLNGTEVVPGVQSATNVKITLTQVKTFAQGGLATVATSGSASDLVTGTLPVAELPLFSSSTNGAVSASGGGTANFLRADGTWAPAGVGSVTSVSVTTANGVSGSVATSTSTPAITLTLGAITPSSVAATGAVTGSNLSGTNTGDETSSTLLTKLSGGSGGGTTNFLRADGTWAAPPGGGSSGTVSSQSGTTYTFAIGDANSWVRSTSTSAAVYTVPPNSSVAFPIGTEIDIVQAGTGGLSVSPGAGVTINARGGATTVSGQYGVGLLKKVLTDTWILSGDVM